MLNIPTSLLSTFSLSLLTFHLFYTPVLLLLLFSTFMRFLLFMSLHSLSLCLSFTVIYFLLFFFPLAKTQTNIEIVKKKVCTKDKSSTSLVSSGSVWSTVSERSFCRYLRALSGSDWAFSSNLGQSKHTDGKHYMHTQWAALTTKKH